MKVNVRRLVFALAVVCGFLADTDSLAAPFAVVRLQTEDPAAFHKLKDFAGLGIKGFPAFVVFPHEPSEREPWCAKRSSAELTE